MSSREEPCPRVPLSFLRTLVGFLAFALCCGGWVENRALTPAAYAQEEDSDEAQKKEESTKDKEPKNDADQDSPEEKEEEPEAEPRDPPAKESEEDKAVNNNEQEKAEEAAGEEVSEKEKAADKEEDRKAAEEEAAGAEVEIDESDEEEEEPAESRESPNKPPVEEGAPAVETPAVPKRLIGATATVMEKQSELLFKARVDSGAKSCSLHIEDYKIEKESENMADNIGKVILFNVANGNDEPHWLQAKIAGYVVVKNATHRERRYKVPLTLRYKDFEKTVLVTLNNREKMEYPLLLGRNYLINDFVVDVSVENGEQHRSASLN